MRRIALLVLVCGCHPPTPPAAPKPTADLIPLSPDERAAEVAEMARDLRTIYSHIDTKRRQWGVDLDALEKRYGNLSRRADTWDRYERVMVAFASELHDAHVAWRRVRAATEKKRRIVRLGLDTRFLDGTLVITQVWPGSGAEKAGLQLGDRIVGVDGETIEQRLGDLSSLRSWSRREAAHYDFAEEWPAERVDAEAPPPTRQVTRQLDDGGYETLTVAPETAPPPGRLRKKDSPLDLERSGDAWLLHVRSLASKPADLTARLDTATARLYTDPRGLVVDLRGNAGGYDQDAKEILARLASTPVTAGTTRVRLSPRARIDRSEWRPLPEDPSQPGWSLPLPIQAEGRSRIRFDRPIAVLIDAGCRSACESLALLLRALGARLVGERTGGSSGAPLTLILQRSQARLTIPAWAAFDAAGHPIEGYGVAPDEEVLTHRSDILTGRDPPLERALAIVSAPPPNLR